MPQQKRRPAARRTKKAAPPPPPTLEQRLVAKATTVYNNVSGAVKNHPVATAAAVGLTVAGVPGAILGAMVVTEQGRAAAEQVVEDAEKALSTATVSARKMYNGAAGFVKSHPVATGAVLGLTAGPVGAIVGAMAGTPQGQAAVTQVATHAADTAKDVATAVSAVAGRALDATQSTLSDAAKKVRDYFSPKP